MRACVRACVHACVRARARALNKNEEEERVHNASTNSMKGGSNSYGYHNEMLYASHSSNRS